MASSSTSQPERLDAFVSFPSPYTQSLIVQALVKLVPSLSLSLIPPPEDKPPRLQWADYDLMTYEIPHANPTTYQTSSYVYRKALIRKHQLHTTFLEYLAKSRHRGNQTILEEAAPKGWTVEIRFADELEEALVDELGELRVGLESNEELEDADRQWYILKPGFADRAQGIRLFSTEAELQAIFEEFEEESSDEEEEDEDEDEDGLIAKTKGIELDDEEEEGTGVLTSQLRHFVIQEYLPRPILFDIAQTYGTPSTGLEGSKFHLRAYVLITGGYTVHLSRTMLALFSGAPYTRPTSSSDAMDLAPHLTNTCLQTDAFGAPAPPEELVKLFWELEGLDALSDTPDGEYKSRGIIDRTWLDQTFAKVGEVVAESVKAGAECGSFGLQLVPNAFEVFGVDLLLNFPSNADGLTIPKVTILEYNASPDFHQSGERLRPKLAEMFQGIIRISIAPFFGLSIDDDDEEKEEGAWEVGAEKWGWRLVGQGQVRGPGI